MKRIFCVLFIVIMVALLALPNTVLAEETENKYELGQVYNTGKDNGYSKNKPIDDKDPHYDWKLGDFYVAGHTRHMIDKDGNIIFLKNVGDEVKLMFDLQQDINALNGNDKLHICEDKNGFEKRYGIKKSNLKKGTLIIKYTDYQNNSEEPQIHIDYLAAKNSEEADTEVMLCQEGDYEVSLLYEIQNDGFIFFDSYYNYRIDFKFSVRNGNTMVFPFDAVTGEELTNSVFTENGFYIDLANSKYLNVDIKKEVLNEGVDGLVEDTRFNRPAKDGEKFTEEGIYTITVTNQYTNVITEKKIYVGVNNVLKAHVVTGLPIAEIRNKISDGKTSIDENGNLVSAEADKEGNNENGNIMSITKIGIIAGGVAILLIIITIIIVAVRKKQKAKEQTNVSEEKEE